MDFDGAQEGYDETYDHDRERSRSPRPDVRGNGDDRARSASPGTRDRADARGAPPTEPPEEDEEAAKNTGTNLFVTGIHPRLIEQDLSRLFEKYGEVERCNIMRDPHTRDSRGFGFVNMMSGDEADAAKDGLQGMQLEGRTLSIEKARRSRPRTPTPGKYFGPPKRDDFRGPPRGGGRFGDRYEDRRGGYGGGGPGRRDDYGGRSSRYHDRYEDRPYRRERRDDFPPRERYDRGGDDRYGGGRSRGADPYYDRDAGRGPPPPPPAGGYGEPAGSSGRYDDRADDRYSRR